MPKAAFDHDIGFQEGEHEPQDFVILDAASNSIHQHVMIDGIEATLDTPLDTMISRRGPSRCWVQLVTHTRERVMGASAGPEAVRDRIEVRLENRLQYQLECHLDQSVFERRDTQRAEFPRLARLRDQSLPDGLRPVTSLSQVFSDVLQKARDTI